MIVGIQYFSVVFVVKKTEPRVPYAVHPQPFRVFVFFVFVCLF